MSHSAGHYRDRLQGTRGNGLQWANEGFSFDSADQLEFIKKMHPELDDPDPQRKRAAWVRFGQTTAGQAFRVR